jgi:nitrogen fixation NifU-like protein
MDDLYRDLILEHYKRPHHFGELEERDRTHLAHETNPLCGDDLSVQIQVQDGVIKDLRFQGRGCAISQAAASMAADELVAMPVDRAASLDASWMFEILGVTPSATRRKCALLGLKAVRAALTGDNDWPRDR